MIRRTNKEREIELGEMAVKYIQGWSQRALADHFKRSKSQVAKDIATIQKDWLRKDPSDLAKLRDLELARLDALEREYWAAWVVSQKSKETASQEKIVGEPGLERRRGQDGQVREVEVPGKARSKASLKTENRDGNPAFLAGIARCIQMRCKLLGLDVPTKINIGVVAKPIEYIEVVQMPPRQPPPALTVLPPPA